MPQIFTIVVRTTYTHHNYDTGGCYDTVVVKVGIVLAESLEEAEDKTEHLKGRYTEVTISPAGEVAYIGEFKSAG